MRLVHVCRTAPPTVGGLENAVHGLCVALAARGHDLRLVTLGERGPEPGQDLGGVEVVRLRRLGSRRWPTAVGLVAACAGASVVHVHGIDGLLDTLVASGVRPLGVSTHGAYFHTPRNRLAKEVWLRTGTRAVLSRVDRVWFSSEADRRRLAPAGRDGTVEPDGVDVARFAAVRRVPEPGRWLVLGRVDVHKGLDDLIPVLARLAPERRFEVRVVGPESAPGLVARLLAQAAAAGVADRLQFLGARDGDGVLEEMARAELALLPSRYEGFGLAAVELMAARVPVVLSEVDAFRPHAAVAPIVPFSDVERAAETIRRTLSGHDPEPAAAHVARFGWPARAESWEQRYRELT